VTDDESFTDLVARAPFTMNDLSLMHERARLLLGKAQRPRSAGGHGDGTLSEKSWRQLLVLKGALKGMLDTFEMLDKDADPEDGDIPF
jgi:hypothetical protein